MPEADKQHESMDGYCPICCKETRFLITGDWHRDQLICSTCINGSVPRERALAVVLEELLPHWRLLDIHESSPADRGISEKLKRESRHYVASQFFPNLPLGQKNGIYRNEDLQNLTFPDEVHDVFISLDVFEHLPDPKKALIEIFRTLRPDGVMLSTFPIRKYQADGFEPRVRIDAKGAMVHLKEPEFHGNPIDPAGSIVTVDYGCDVHQLFAQWSGFNVRVHRFADRRHGKIGEYTDVMVCRKPAAAPL